MNSNSLLIAVTETWLHHGVLDAEVCHNIPGYSILRCDRTGRDGGGVALYLRDDLTGDVLGTFDNGVCQLLVVQVHQLDTIVAAVYRPPDTRLEEFKPLLKKLDETLSGLPSPNPIVTVMGDFNLPKATVKWLTSEDGWLVPSVADHREGETVGGNQDRLQASQLINLASKHSLIQQVDMATHAIEILDLVFTNDADLVSSVQADDWPSFTDHKLITIDVSYKTKSDNVPMETQFLCETGKRYKNLNFFLAPWDQIQEELESINWEDMEKLANPDTTAALCLFHDKLLAVLERLVPAKKKFTKVSKSKVDRMRKNIWRRIAKVKEKILVASSIQKLTSLIQKKRELEEQLRNDYSAENSQQEDQAIFNLKSNANSFFNFAKSRQKTKARIGPFLDPTTGKLTPDTAFTAETLRQQYNSVFSWPRPEWVVKDVGEHFCVGDSANSLDDIAFTSDDIEEACKELKGSASAGPDGVPASLLKTCRKQLARPLYILWRASMDTGSIPAELLLVMICPIHKGGSRSAPKNYRPVALTSHIIKVFERVIRRVLVKHVEDNNILPAGQHGSRSLRSTLTQLISHWDNILDGLEHGRGVDCVYLDFSKAFDKVETGVLLHKLKDAKILCKRGRWLASFLDSK